MFKEIDALESIVKKAAVEELLPRFAKVRRQHKQDGSFVTEADFSIQNRLANELSSRWPEIVLLAEEMTAEEQQTTLSSDSPIWCLDPLDGTSNFAAGIPYFAVSLALIHKGRIKLGLVYDPVRDECFIADEDGTVTLNAETLALKSEDVKLKHSSAIIDFKRLSDELSIQLIKEKPFSSQRNFGASALDWCWIAAGRGHVYCHGQQNLWDYAAGYLIFKNAGGYCCTFQSEEIFINSLKPRSVIAAVNEPLFNEWKNWVQNARG